MSACSSPQAVAGRSKRPKESKASPTPLVERIVVIIRDKIQSPVFSYPLPPRDGHILTGESRKNRGWTDDLIRFLSKPRIHRYVVMVAAALRDSDEARWGEDNSGIANIESHPVLDDPGPLEIIGGTYENALIPMHIL